MSLRHLCVTVLLFAGVGVEVISCLGLIVMRDALDRLHCAGAVGFGAVLVSAAIVVQDSFSLIGNKALAVAGLLALANPVVVHMTARMVRSRALGDWRLHPDEGVEVEAP